jgi:protein DEK
METYLKIHIFQQNIKQSELTLLHRLLFKRPGTAHEIKKNIKEFSGFPFAKEDKEFESRKHLLEK